MPATPPEERFGSAAPASPWLPLLLIAPFFLWGTAMVAMKEVLNHTAPFFLASVRLLPAGMLVLVAAAWMKRPLPRSWQAWAWISLFSLIDGTLFQGLLAQGLQRTGAGLGSVMIDSQPILIALLAAWLFAERIGGWGWLGLGLGIAGISLIGLPSEWWTALVLWLSGRDPSVLQAVLPEGNWLLAIFDNGQWLMLLAAVSMGVGTVISRYVARYADPVVATGWHMILGSVPLLLGVILWEPQPWQALTHHDWLALGYSTIFGSAIAYGLFFWFAATGNLTSFTALTFLTPIFALLFSSLLLGERLIPLQWAGVCLTLLSIWLINQREVISQWLQARLSRAQAGG
jgi:drug/metabolite transporter (DMT)-like permease